MSSAVAAALIAASAAVVGWFVTHLLSVRGDQRRQVQEARLAYVERQLEQLYGPLAFLVLEGEGSFRDQLDTLGRSVVFEQGTPSSQDELDLWLFWVDNDFMPRNKAIQQLLSSKSHLIDDFAIPDTYRAFIAHYNSWRVSHVRWQKDGVPYTWHSKIDYPDEFPKQVLATFDKLKREHATLVGRLAAESRGGGPAGPPALGVASGRAHERGPHTAT